MRMKMSGMILLVAGIVTIVSTTAWAAGTSKIGYFEMATVLQESKWGKRSTEEFKKQQETIKADVDVKAKAFKTAKEEFDKKKDVMDEKAKAKKLKELQDMQQEGEKLLMDSQGKLSKLSGDLRAPLVDKIIEIVKKIGRDDKYDFIFERETAGLVFTNEKEDLTRRIAEELDKAGPKK